MKKAFDGEKGLGYPAERRESQNANAIILSNMKEAVSKPLMDALGPSIRSYLNKLLVAKNSRNASLIIVKIKNWLITLKIY